MKSIVVLTLALMLLSCSSSLEREGAADINRPNESAQAYWSKEKEAAHISRRQDSTTWDKEMLATDLQYQMEKTLLPFQSGVFPNPHYDLVGEGSFKGVGNFGLSGGDDNELKLGDKTILYNAFYVGASEVNQAFLGEKKDEVFFQIMVLTDFVDTVNYSHVLSEVVSRNHPHYIAQGSYKTKASSIDYAAFITADRNAYAIVNMRLFDLNLGKTILIAPQKDGSFRSMQLPSPPLSKDDVEGYSKQLLLREEVQDFFNQEGGI